MQTEKHFEYALLLDIYGGLLTTKQRDALDMSLNEDLSLSEIAENAGISRQAAQDAIKKAEQRLSELEEALGIYKKREAVGGVLKKLAAAGADKALLENIRKILWED